MQFVILVRALVATVLFCAVGCSSVGDGGAGISSGDLAPPTVPAGVTAAKVAPLTISVNWQAANDTGSGVAGYHIFRNGGSTAVATAAAGELSFDDAALSPDTDYSYSVSAYDRASPPNESAPSAVSSAVRTDPRGGDTTAPSIPQNLAAVAQSSMAIALSWQASTDNAGGSGIGGYRIYRDGMNVAQVTAATLSYTDTGLMANTAYSYTVRAIDMVGNRSAHSGAANAMTMMAADALAPSIPQSLTALTQSTSNIALAWQAATDNTGGSGLGGYRVFRSGMQVAQLAASVLTYSDVGLAASTAYSYTVRAFDKAGNESANSNSAAATTLAATDTTAPSIPPSLTAVAQSSSSIKLTWQASSDNAGGSGLGGYRVFRGGVQLVQVAAGMLAYTDTGLAVSTAYSYTVRAYDNAGNQSANSNTATATTQALATGMSQRPGNATCIAPPRPGTGGGTIALSVQRVFPNLNFGNSNGISGAFQAPGDSSRWFVTELDGHIRSFVNNQAATTSSMFLDIASRVAYGGELGLFGIAFHPNFPADPRAFVSYTTNAGGRLQSRISQFSSADGGQSLNAASEIVLATVNQPAANHNGGFIAFGPDRMLYFGLGDGGSENDPWGTIGNGQNTKTLLAKILRVDVGPANSVKYTIPATNPFQGNALCNIEGSTSPTDCPEIYAWGVRNPWKGSFDRQTGQLWLGDVGQDLWEEVDRINLGGNYGWRCREGAHAFNGNCGPGVNLIDPVAELAHNGYTSITGGYVYRGSAIPALIGQYVFADFLNGLYTLSSTATPTVTVSGVTPIGLWVSAFAEDQSGELYVVEYGGHLYKLVGSGGGVTNTIPDKLSATGCVSASNPTLPAPGLIPYAPNAPFWSDGAVKRRWLALPNGAKIDTTPANGDWTFPPGTVLMKDFSLGNQLIETRLFMRHPDGVWAGYTYQWDAAQTEATRVTGGKDVSVAGQTWHIPSESECLRCHTQAAGYSLGPETGQLNGNFAYPAAPSPPFTGLTANQVHTMNSIALFNPAIAGAPATLLSFPDPLGANGTLAARARSYLHTNCSHCHRPSGGTTVDLDLRYQTAISATKTCGVTPADNLGIAGALRIKPNDPDHSLIYLRMHQRGPKQMPPLASNLVDTAGAALLYQWISGMNPSCQ